MPPAARPEPDADPAPTRPGARYPGARDIDPTPPGHARWLDGLADRARESLPYPVWQYLAQGARDQISAGEATAAWQRIRFAPYTMADVGIVHTATSALGTHLSAPIAIAPTSFQRAVHPHGEVAMARAAAEAGSLVVVSSNSGSTFADIGATGAAWWVQAYLSADRELSRPWLERAVAAGARVVVLTVDTPVVGTKYVDGPSIFDQIDPAVQRVEHDPRTRDEPGAAKATDLGAGDIAWLTACTGLPVVVKGLLRADDALRWVAAGASAVWVSNHGGRQLDRSLSTAEALPGIVAAVGRQVEVYVDGGLRSGLDVLAALALGARVGFLGRPPAWALLDGTPGVLRMYRDLQAELVESLRLAGLPEASHAPEVLYPQTP